MNRVSFSDTYAIIIVIYSQASALYCPLRTAVCATDGKTYPTVCHMKLVAAEVGDLHVLHDGPCYLVIDKNDGPQGKSNLKRTEDKNETKRIDKKENVNIILRIDKNNLRIRLRGCEECWQKCSREFDSYHIMLAGECVRCCFNKLQTQNAEESSVQPLLFHPSKQWLKRTKYKQKFPFLN